VVGELFNVSEQLQHNVIFIYFMSNVEKKVVLRTHAFVSSERVRAFVD
jgi:hypothetical protein